MNYLASDYHYKENVLHVENISTLDILDKVGSPVYCYSKNAIEENYKKFSDAVGRKVKICYAVKANPNVAIINLMAKMGAGADVVSIGEIKSAIIAGLPANKIVFSGVGKTFAEIEFALEFNIYQFNVESFAELYLISEIATQKRTVASVSIRVNPNLDAKTHDKVTTGLKSNKFGISEEYIDEIFNTKLPGIDLVGISVHIGSNITDLKVFATLINKVKNIARKLSNISRIDLGGGLGIPYFPNDNCPTLIDYATLIKDNTNELGCEIICEPGRALVGNSGVLLSKILYVKENDEVKHIILDVGMNDLLRPALYNSHHQIIPIIKKENLALETVDIVGPVCESDDTFVRNYKIQPLESGEYVAICTVGAYGHSMASTYNTRLLPPEVLINNNQFAEIRKRSDYEDLIRHQIIPGW